VVSEDHPLVGRNEIAAVVETLRRSSAQRIERQHFGRNEAAVEAVSDGVGRNGGNDEPEGVDLLAAMQSDCGQRQRSEQADGNPGKNAQEFRHEESCPVASIVAKTGRVRKRDLDQSRRSEAYGVVAFARASLLWVGFSSVLVDNMPQVITLVLFCP
jgi:hypothetical protein